MLVPPQLVLMLAAQGSLLDTDPVQLHVAIVRDPELPALEPALVKAALEHARKEFELRFGAKAPTFEVVNELSVSGFLGAYALPIDPACKPLYAARYRGGGPRELEREKQRALKFFRRWSLDSLKGFIAEDQRATIRSHQDIYDYYATHYTKAVDAMKGLSTEKGTPLVEPGRSTKRSFAAWTCALRRQQDYDVILSNAFILADLMNEPHPHAVFGKAKVGGIAAHSPGRTALDGQALLATTFGIDTKITQFKELSGDAPPTFEERARILGAYLLAHEVAHAIFGIPDVFDHPPGCLMTSRPGETYREGLKELTKHPRPCPRCRPYVETRSLIDRGRRAFEAKQYRRTSALLKKALRKMPKHMHGGRKRRVSRVLLLASKAQLELGRTKRAKKYAGLAMKLDPKSEAAIEHWQSMVALPPRTMASITVSRTASTSTAAP